MKIYFMGICGTAMGNAALLAREAGHAKPIYRFDAGLRYAWAERFALQLGGARIEGAEEGYQGDATLTVGW